MHLEPLIDAGHITRKILLGEAGCSTLLRALDVDFVILCSGVLTMTIVLLVAAGIATVDVHRNEEDRHIRPFPGGRESVYSLLGRSSDRLCRVSRCRQELQLRSISANEKNNDRRFL